MPLDPGSISVIMEANLAPNSFVGISAPQLALGLANGLTVYASSGLTVTSIDVGVVGAGVGLGVGVIIPTPALLASLISSFTSSGIVGIAMPLLANALSLGFTQAFATAIINTVDPTVGVGSGIVTPIPNPTASALAFISGFTSAGLIGIAAAQLAVAISVGLDTVLPSSKGVTVIAGSPSLIPSSGVGFGKLS